MKITIDINGKDYFFEMNRAVYKQLLADQEYAQMQNEISKRIKEKNFVKNDKDEIINEMFEDDITKLILQNLVMEEQIFYYSLLIHQPEIDRLSANELLDIAIMEYGAEEVSNLCSKIMENFTQRGETPKKKMVMRMS